MKLGPRVGVHSVKPLGGFRVLVVFDNDTQREIDFERYLQGPIFEPMRNDPEVFRLMAIARGVITWPNSADIDPDVLYYGLQPARMETEDARCS
jgi:hypothetical protein